MKVISYSLWGTHPLYLHGALVNAKQMLEHFPGWQMRVYHDSSVPQETLDSLGKFEHVKLIEVTDGSYGMFWRFRALFEEGLDAVLIRDTDSRFSWRDVRCVTEWLESPLRLSVIRDHMEHYKVPILGGLFGLKGGPLPFGMLGVMHSYARHHHYNTDQIFLSDHVWPLLRSSCFNHGFMEHEWMKNSRTDDIHMGRGFTVDETPRMDHGGDVHKPYPWDTTKQVKM